MNRIQLTLVLVMAVLSWEAAQGTAVAQLYGLGRSRSVGRATQNYIYNRPTVSPYVNLATRSSTAGLPNYFTMVRPQLEAREREVAEQRQSAHMQAQLNEVQTQVQQAQQNAAGMMLTGRVGWSARGYPRFGTYMNYYPGFHRIPR